MKILANSYFSGAGLMDLGLQEGGTTIQQSFEIDAACCETLAANFGHEAVRGDITQKLVSAEKPCDVMVATASSAKCGEPFINGERPSALTEGAGARPR